MERTETTTTLTVPATFWLDHLDRALRCGETCPDQDKHQNAEGEEYFGIRTKSGYKVTLNRSDLNELLSDADYYASQGTAVFGPEALGLISSARATVTRIRKARQ